MFGIMLHKESERYKKYDLMLPSERSFDSLSEIKRERERDRERERARERERERAGERERERKRVSSCEICEASDG